MILEESGIDFRQKEEEEEEEGWGWFWGSVKNVSMERESSN